MLVVAVVFVIGIAVVAGVAGGAAAVDAGFAADALSALLLLPSRSIVRNHETYDLPDRIQKHIQQQ